jgi:hypothetical protein
MAVRDDFTAGEVLAAADLNDTFAAKLNLAGGKVLQIVRSTDSTDRSTTSITFVDASISVTITPQESTSEVLVIWTAFLAPFAGEIMRLQLTDSSNVALSGAEFVSFGNSTANTWRTGSNIIGRIVPGVTTAVTYKGRFLSAGGGSCSLFNASNTGQIYAIEVSA